MTDPRPIHPARHAARLAALIAPLLMLLGDPAGARSITAPRNARPEPVKRVRDEYPALSATEKKMVAEVNRGVPASLALLERTVNVNSGTLNLAGVREVGRMFDPEFQALGFTTRWSDGAAWNRAGHLVATRMPTATAAARRRPAVRAIGADAGAPAALRLLLIGHLDTVFEPDSPFQRWERNSDSTARGPGVTDMKGGNVVMLLALRALREAGVLDRVAVTVVLTGDEERSGDPIELARRDLLEAADWADVAIGFEDGDGDPRTAVIVRRGSTAWRLDVTARPYHSSQVFREDIGEGAIYEAARLLRAFRDSLRDEPSLTYNPGLVLGGTQVDYDSSKSRGTAFGKSNVIAERAVVTGDLRALSLEQRSRAKATMERVVAAGSPHTRSTIRFDDGYPPFGVTDGNRKLLAVYDRVSRDLGQGPVTAEDPLRAGAADIAFTGGRVEMAIDGVGLMGEGGHTVNEVADLRSLPAQAQRVALTIHRLAADWARRDGAR